MNQEEKWMYCPDQVCYYCHKEMEDEDVEKDRIVTGCPFCNRSFVE